MFSEEDLVYRTRQLYAQGESRESIAAQLHVPVERVGPICDSEDAYYAEVAGGGKQQRILGLVKHHRYLQQSQQSLARITQRVGYLVELGINLPDEEATKPKVRSSIERSALNYASLRKTQDLEYGSMMAKIEHEIQTLHGDFKGTSDAAVRADVRIYEGAPEEGDRPGGGE